MPKLRLAHRTFDAFDRALIRQVEHFRAQHPDVEVELRDLDVPDLYRELVTDGGLADGRYDLAIVLTDWMPQLMADKIVRPLDSLLSTNPPADWPHGWAESVLRLQRDSAGHVYGLPYHNGPEVLIYRTDLFENPAEREQFERRYGRPLGPPATWDEFMQVAEFFHRPQDNLYGCVVAGYPDGHNTVYDFFLQLWARGGEIFDGQGRPAFAGDEGIAALRWLHDLVVTRGLTQPDPLACDSVRSGEVFASGRAAMMWNWIGFAIVAEFGDSPLRRRIRCAPMPTLRHGDRSDSLSVYWALTIGAGSANPDYAYAFMRATTSPEMDRVTAEEGAVGCRLSTWRDPGIRQSFPPYQVMEKVHHGARNLPRTPKYPVVNEILNDAIDAAYRGRTTVEVALSEAAQQISRWETTMREYI